MDKHHSPAIKTKGDKNPKKIRTQDYKPVKVKKS